MSFQTIIVSNRNVLKGGKFGDKLGVSDYRLAIADALPLYVEKRVRNKNKKGFSTKNVITKNPYKVNLIPENEEGSILAQQIAKYDNGKPWLFFVHGNNQTFQKNLIKSRLIQETYDANMVIYSWPSRSYNDKAGWNLFLALVNFAIKNPFSGFSKLKKILENKIKQYREASKMALEVKEKFEKSLALLQSKFFIPLKNNYPDLHISLLVHSLGHKIIKASVKGESVFSNFSFSNVLFHQADELSDNHQIWMKEFSGAKTENVHVTRNKKDAALFLSDMLHHLVPENGQVNLKLLKRMAKSAINFKQGDSSDENLFTRIGNRDEFSQNYGDLKALELTGLESVGMGHSIVWDENVSEQVLAKTKPILSGSI